MRFVLVVLFASACGASGGMSTDADPCSFCGNLDGSCNCPLSCFGCPATLAEAAATCTYGIGQCGGFDMAYLGWWADQGHCFYDPASGRLVTASHWSDDAPARCATGAPAACAEFMAGIPDQCLPDGGTTDDASRLGDAGGD